MSKSKFIESVVELKQNKVLITAGLVVGVGTLAYFLLARPILTKLNIIDSRDDKKAKKFLEKAHQDGFFKPTYYKQNESKITLTTTNAKLIAKYINDSWGLFNDDEEAVYANMMFIKTKEDLSFVSYWYSQRAGASLLDDLYKKLSSKEFLRIEMIYNNLQ
jgi:hypothetical protein